MTAHDLQSHLVATWMVTLDGELRITTLREPGAGSREVPFISDYPINVPLAQAMALNAPSSAQLTRWLKSGAELKDYRYSIDHELLGRRHYTLSAVPIRDTAGVITGFHCSITDLTGTLDLMERGTRHQAELDAIIDASSALLTVKDLEGRYVRVSAPAQAFFANWTSEDVLGRTAAELFPADIAGTLCRGDLSVMDKEAREEFEQHFWVGDQFRTYLTHKFPISDREGCLVALGAMSIDISERKRMEGELNQLANFDPLTELPNRRLNADHLNQAVALARFQDSRVAAILVDIDGFRALNNTLGTDAGDQILIEMAWRLKSCIPDSATVARLGGDDFCIVLGALDSTRLVSSVVAAINRALEPPLVINGRDIFVRVTTGSAMYPLDADGPEQIIQRADIALMEAKRLGQPSLEFCAEMLRAAECRTVLVGLLRQAVARSEMRLVYQPIVDANTGQCAMMEALMRWHSAEKGIVAPGQFIDIAEETGLVIPLGAWALRQACEDAAAWNAGALRPIAVAVNVSPRQLLSEGFVSFVSATLASTGLAPALLEIEVTESSMIRDMEGCKRVMVELAALGVALTLDDFGTGYSALSYLQQLPFHTLKLDQSFVRSMTPGEPSAALTASIIAMASSLGMKTVGEGVEDAILMETLRGQGCHYVQGYHLSRPLPKEQLTALGFLS